MEAMEYAEACASIESRCIKKSAVVKSCKYYLLIYLKNRISLLLLCSVISVMSV